LSIASPTEYSAFSCEKIKAGDTRSKSIWEHPHSLTTRWGLGSRAPEINFQPKQYVEVPLYNKEFMSKLADIDFRIRAFALCERQNNQRLDEVHQRVKPLISAGHIEHSLQILNDIVKIQPFHLPSLQTLLYLYGIQGNHSASNLIKSWLNQIVSVGVRIHT